MREGSSSDEGKRGVGMGVGVGLGDMSLLDYLPFWIVAGLESDSCIKSFSAWCYGLIFMFVAC